MLTVFIDANVYLSFYEFSPDDLNELEKLGAAIKARELHLLTTEQVVHEFNRRREADRKV